MLRVGAPLLAAFCGGALSGCGGEDSEPQPPPVSIKPAWVNHLEGFGLGVSSKQEDTDNRTAALDMIMAGYDDNSVVTIWDASKSDADNCKDGKTASCKPNVEHKGLAGIRSMFDGLFNDLQGCNDDTDGLNATFEVAETTASAPGSVFLVWECKKQGFITATDTFIFQGVKILKQNVVIEKKPQDVVSQGLRQAEEEYKPESSRRRMSSPRRRRTTPEPEPGSVRKSWTNHVEAFFEGANGEAPYTAALDRIMQDYTDDSAVHVATYAHDASDIPTLQEHKGIEQIRKLFLDIFTRINDPCNLETPLAEVDGGGNGEALQVFLVWRNLASKIKWATETFVFGDGFKILKQNMVEVQAQASDKGGCKSIVNV